MSEVLIFFIFQLIIRSSSDPSYKQVLLVTCTIFSNKYLPVYNVASLTTRNQKTLGTGTALFSHLLLSHVGRKVIFL